MSTRVVRFMEKHVGVQVRDTDQQGKKQAKIITKNIVCREVLS